MAVELLPLPFVFSHCNHCGKPIRFYRSQRRMYCSRTCKVEASRGRPLITR